MTELSHPLFFCAFPSTPLALTLYWLLPYIIAYVNLGNFLSILESQFLHL